MRFNVFVDPHISANHRVVTDRYAPQDRGVGVDPHIILDYWMTRNIDRITKLIEPKALGTQRHTLIDNHIFANDRRLANHHACTVVDSEVTCNGRSRVNINSTLRVSNLSYHSRNNRHPQLMQTMSYTMVRNSHHRWITQHNLGIRRSGRIGLIYRLDIGGQE